MNEREKSGIDCSEIAGALHSGVEVKPRKYRLRTYDDCFVGSEAVDWFVQSGAAHDRPQAVTIGQVLLAEGYLHHVLREHDFEDDALFYRFASDEDHGHKGAYLGSPGSWRDLMGELDSAPRHGLQSNIPQDEALSQMLTSVAAAITPRDEFNLELLDQVHPPNWMNPQPAGRYNMVVIGAGAGGLVTAASVAGLGGRVALIEEHLLGGDCLNFGCVPSKALLRSARAAADVRRAAEFGVHIDGEVRIDFAAVMERLRRLRSEISHHDSAERFAQLGVDVFIGRGRFTGPDTVAVGDTTLTFAKACIATGASPAVPPIEGLEEVEYLTNMSVFNLTELPASLAIVGAGVIGCEMAQAFARLGSSVTVYQFEDRILPREDADAAAIVHAALARDGVQFRFESPVKRVEQGAEGIRTFAGGKEAMHDALLIATGRKPNVEGLGLEVAGVDFDGRLGVAVDDQLVTSNRNVFAVGDVATKYKFTHAADFMARHAVRNALFFGSEKFSKLLIPWCTYTEPEIAHVGLYPHDLDERGIAYETFTRDFADVDRAKLEGATEGFVRIHVKAGSDTIVGATIVGPDAGNMISEVTVAMQAGMGLGALAGVIHPYPTLAEAIRQTGDAYNRTRLTPTVKSLFRNLLAVRR